MPPTETFDSLVLGSGEGGKYLAWHMAQSGRRVAVVERKLIGGSCPNTNCLPSKNEIWSANVARLVRDAAKFGTMAGSVTVNMAQTQRRKREMVDGLIAMHLDHFKASGAELIMGTGRFVGPKTIEVRLNDGGTRILTGDRLYLNLGTRATIPDIPGLDGETRPLTNIELLELDRLPERLIVLGGGYVGLEFAQAYRRFGSRITIIERGLRLAGREDPDISQALLEVFQNEGIEVLLSTETVRVHGLSGERVALLTQTSEGERSIEGSDLLIAVGRTPNTFDIGLESAGVELDARGYIKVNDRLETTAPDVWAIEECAGSPQFTHASYDDFRIIRDNLAGGDRTKRDRLVPFCMFTDPPLACVGLNESEAQQLGIPVRVAKLPTKAILRTRTTSETNGFLKALVAAHDDRVLGFAMFGAEAGEVMAVVQVAMLARFPYTRLRDAILTHPTMAEGLNALFGLVQALPAAAQTAAQGSH